MSHVFQRTVIADFHTNIETPPFIRASMHVCVAQAPTGRIDWSANEQKCPIEFSASGTIWADDVQG